MILEPQLSIGHVMNGRQALFAWSKPKHSMQTTCWCPADDDGDDGETSNSKNGVSVAIGTEQPRHVLILLYSSSSAIASRTSRKYQGLLFPCPQGLTVLWIVESKRQSKIMPLFFVVIVVVVVIPSFREPRLS
jgi:hypothetical protein